LLQCMRPAPSLVCSADMVSFTDASSASGFDATRPQERKFRD
jgi:hypothetical protein